MIQFSSSVVVPTVTPGAPQLVLLPTASLEACVKARNAGREIEKESRDILMEAGKHSPELAIALEPWKEIKFEFDTVDKLDVQ